MMRRIALTLAIPVLVGLACFPAWAAVDLKSGSYNEGSFRVGLYSPHGSGSQDDVREFDGRTLNPASLEYLEWLGYSGDWQYSVFGQWLLAHDIDAAVGLGYRNRFGLNWYRSTLTHRLEARRAGDIALVGPTPGTDLSPDTNFGIVRTVDDIYMRFLDSSQNLRIVTNFWQQSKDGTQQIIGRWNTGTGNIKHVVAAPLHSETTQSTVGTDVKVGSGAAVNYRYTLTKYGQNNVSIATNTTPRHPTQINSDTKTSKVTARAAITDRLYFTGLYLTRDRTNTRASFVEGNPASMNFRAGNAGLTWLVTDDLTLTARYRMTDQDSHVVPIIGSGQVRNNALSTKLRSSAIEASYAGIRHMFVKAGYERKDIDRSTQFTADSFAELEPSSKSDIFTGSVRYYPTGNLSISAYGLIDNTDRSGYAGTPNKRKQLTANATYMLRDNFALYGDFYRLDERNNLVRVPFAGIPLAVGSATDEELRVEAAGQGYDNEQTTGTIGAWYALNSKLVLDANCSRITTDASSLWILGLDANAANNTLPNLVSFNTRNNQYSTGLTYQMTPKWSFYGRYILSNSDGRGLLDPALYPPGVGPTWLPVDVRQHTYTVGFAHELSARDRLLLDFSVSEYVDRINAANTGTFDVWRLAWSRQF